MKLKHVVSFMLVILLLSAVIPQATANTESRAYLLEQALLQQLHATIYQSLQELYQEEYPQFDEVKIINIESYITGNILFPTDAGRKASASGGATVYNITVEVKAIHHDEIVQMVMNNEQEGYMYTVKDLKTRKLVD